MEREKNNKEKKKSQGWNKSNLERVFHWIRLDQTNELDESIEGEKRDSRVQQNWIESNLELVFHEKLDDQTNGEEKDSRGWHKDPKPIN